MKTAIFSPQQVTKKRIPKGGIQVNDFITYHNIRLKNYLNLSYDKINSPTQSRRDLTTLARAINDLKQNLIKKENQSTTFETLTDNSSFILSTVHSILSPAFMFNIFAIVAGTELFTALVLLAPFIIFVFCLKITVISSIFINHCYYIYNDKYINFTPKSIMKRLIFIYYEGQFIIRGEFLKAATFKNCLKNQVNDLYE